MPRRSVPRSLWLAVPLLLAVAAYGRSLRGEFLFDDVRTVQENALLAHPAELLRGFGDALLHGGRPTTDVAFALARAAGGPSPRSFHAASLLAHLAVVGLVLVFTRAVLRLAGSGPATGISIAVAGLFALHPMQTQAVSYVSQLSEVLASGFYLATLLLLLQARRAGPGIRGALPLAAALATFSLGMGAKPIVVTAPLAWVLLVLLVPPASARGGKARWPWLAALIAPLVVVAGLAARGALSGAAGRADAGFSVPGSSPGSYFLTQWRAVATYLRLLAWPSGQSADWSFPMSRSLWDPGVLLSGGALAALLVAASVLWWRCRSAEGPEAADGRAAAYGVAWFFLLLAPTSSFLPIADVLVEHRVYLASWGIFLAVAIGGSRLLSRLPPDRRAWAAPVAVGLAWLVLASASYRRNAVWEDELTFWRDVASKGSDRPRSHLGLGVAMARRGDRKGAAAEFSRGLERAPAEAKGLRQALLFNLGSVLVDLGRYGDAVPPLRQALALDPGDPSVPQVLALALYGDGDLDGAEAAAHGALGRAPDDALAARVLGKVAMARGDFSAAVPLLERAVRGRPSDAPVRYDLGAAYANLGRVAEACASWRAVLRLPAAAGAQEAARSGIAVLACPP